MAWFHTHHAGPPRQPHSAALPILHHSQAMQSHCGSPVGILSRRSDLNWEKR